MKENKMTTEDHNELNKMAQLADEILTAVADLPMEDAEFEMEEEEFELLTTAVGRKLYSEANEAWAEGGENGYNAWKRQNISKELIEKLDSVWGIDSLTTPAMNRVYNLQDNDWSMNSPAYNLSRRIVDGGRDTLNQIVAEYKLAL